MLRAPVHMRLPLLAALLSWVGCAAEPHILLQCDPGAQTGVCAQEARSCSAVVKCPMLDPCSDGSCMLCPVLAGCPPTCKSLAVDLMCEACLCPPGSCSTPVCVMSMATEKKGCVCAPEPPAAGSGCVGACPPRQCVCQDVVKVPPSQP
jgi:hypothetical protein